MPVELKNLEEFIEVTARAIECRVKRAAKQGKDGKIVKVKARTKRYLYTYKTTEDKLEEVLSKVKCKKIIDVDKGEVIKEAK